MSVEDDQDAALEDEIDSIFEQFEAIAVGENGYAACSAAIDLIRVICEENGPDFCGFVLEHLQELSSELIETHHATLR